MFIESVKGLGEFEFHEHYFIGRVKEEVNADYQFIDTLTALINRHYSGRPIIYISDRVNSYSLDVSAASQLIKQNNIRYIGVVTYNRMQKGVYSFEKQMIDEAELCSFDSLIEAVEWAECKSKAMNN